MFSQNQKINKQEQVIVAQNEQIENLENKENELANLVPHEKSRKTIKANCILLLGTSLLFILYEMCEKDVILLEV